MTWRNSWLPFSPFCFLSLTFQTANLKILLVCDLISLFLFIIVDTFCCTFVKGRFNEKKNKNKEKEEKVKATNPCSHIFFIYEHVKKLSIKFPLSHLSFTSGNEQFFACVALVCLIDIIKSGNILLDATRHIISSNKDENISFSHSLLSAHLLPVFHFFFFVSKGTWYTRTHDIILPF